MVRTLQTNTTFLAPAGMTAARAASTRVLRGINQMTENSVAVAVLAGREITADGSRVKAEHVFGSPASVDNV